MRKIVYTRPDGGLSIVVPCIGTKEDLTEAEAEARAYAMLPPDAGNPRWAKDDEFPADRTFRDAWTDTGTVSVDMPKAREIHREKLRQLRAPKLAAEDTAFMRAIEADDKAEAARVALRKKALRDVTDDPRIDAAKTPDELKAAIPEALR